MIRAFLLRASAGLRPAATATRRGVSSSSSSATATTALRLQQRQHPQQQRRLLLATGATICTLTAYTTLAGQPAKVSNSRRWNGGGPPLENGMMIPVTYVPAVATTHPCPNARTHSHPQADAALATGPEATHAPKSGGTNVTIQARLSSPKTGAKPAAEAEAEGKEEVEQAEMSRHGTVVEAEGEGTHEPQQQPAHHEGDELDDADIEEEETAEDAKYDGVELEETDCPLCHFMRVSACGPTWVRWEKCIHYHKEKEEDFVGPCSRVTLRLAQCIEKHKESFPPMLRNALLGGGGKGEAEADDDEIAEDGEVDRAQAKAQVQQGDDAAAPTPAPETSAALAATTTATVAAAAEQK